MYRRPRSLQYGLDMLWSSFIQPSSRPSTSFFSIPDRWSLSQSLPELEDWTVLTESPKGALGLRPALRLSWYPRLAVLQSLLDRILIDWGDGRKGGTSNTTGQSFFSNPNPRQVKFDAIDYDMQRWHCRIVQVRRHFTDSSLIACRQSTESGQWMQAEGKDWRKWGSQTSEG